MVDRAIILSKASLSLINQSVFLHPFRQTLVQNVTVQFSTDIQKRDTSILIRAVFVKQLAKILREKTYLNHPDLEPCNFAKL